VQALRCGVKAAVRKQLFLGAAGRAPSVPAIAAKTSPQQSAAARRRARDPAPSGVPTACSASIPDSGARSDVPKPPKQADAGHAVPYTRLGVVQAGWRRSHLSACRTSFLSPYTSYFSSSSWVCGLVLASAFATWSPACGERQSHRVMQMVAHTCLDPRAHEVRSAHPSAVGRPQRLENLRGCKDWA
jgi:hypothetical protein